MSGIRMRVTSLNRFFTKASKEGRMINILMSIRVRLLQFSNYWFSIEERYRHIILVLFPVLAGAVLTTVVSATHRDIENYFGVYSNVFCFIVSSAVMFIFVWLLAVIMDERRIIESQTCKDYLTGVYTRRYTYAEATKMVAAASRSNKIICVCFVDLDNLKPINDTYSHGAGDEALALVGQTLLDEVRITDLVGRYGGDEFVVVWTTDTKDSITIMLNRITDAINHMTLQWQDKDIVITASMGFSHGYCPPKSDPEKTLKDLIKEADGILNGAKKHRKKISRTVEKQEPAYLRPEMNTGIDTE
jgi:diguanylate cyclase (GGDEF)-like protein